MWLLNSPLLTHIAGSTGVQDTHEARHMQCGTLARKAALSPTVITHPRLFGLLQSSSGSAARTE
tara:strand:- start:3223 stop:3414 length:192 start_codon:yes stop_codon:yes gene_type:complete